MGDILNKYDYLCSFVFDNISVQQGNDSCYVWICSAFTREEESHGWLGHIQKWRTSVYVVGSLSN